MPVPQLDYVSLFAMCACAVFFARGAREEHRSPLLWGALSVAFWLGMTNVLVGGLWGGLLSQLALYTLLGVRGVLRDRRA